jgi:hypothetical protein
MNSINECFLNPFATARTLDTGTSWVISNCPLAAFYRHCLQDIQETSPGCIQNRLSESGSRQTFNAQVLKRHQIVSVTQPMRDLIMKFFAFSLHVEMKASNPIGLPLVVFRTLGNG